VAALRKDVKIPFEAVDAQCPVPADSKLAALLSGADAKMDATLDQISDLSMEAKSRAAIAQIRAAATGAHRADVVNDLSAAYCRRLARVSSMQPKQKRARYYRFGRLAYQQLGGV
jgi:hypothetical protein